MRTGVGGLVNVNIQGLRDKKQKVILARFCRNVCLALPRLRKNGEISFIFLPGERIRKVNRKYLNHDCDTDVISFSYPLDPSHGEVQPLGDIYISMDMAKRQAMKGKCKVVQELALYSLHGLLHLVGYDDHSPNDRRIMFAKQTKIFRKVSPRLAPPDFR